MRNGSSRGQNASIQMAHILILMFGVVGLPLLRAQEANSLPTELFVQANRAYENSDFEEAARLYRRILQYDIHHAAVYYNLGNTYFKLGRLGQAILQYERARRLDPTDGDLSENLAFVNSLRVDKMEDPETPLWFRGLTYLHDFVGLRGQVQALVVLWLLANSGLLLWILRREPAWRRVSAYIMTLSLLLLLPLLVSIGVKVQQDSRWEGIIVADRVDLLSGPSRDNPVLVTVHEGIKVEIRNSTGDWYQIVLPNGWNGWVPGESLETI